MTQLIAIKLQVMSTIVQQMMVIAGGFFVVADALVDGGDSFAHNVAD